jgi:putative hydrolase of the HAD superfamily
MILIFDLDDTLYPEIKYVESGLRAVAKFGFEEFGWDAGESYVFMRKDLTANGRGRIFDNWLTSRGYFSKTYLRKCIKVYRHHEPKICLQPNTEVLLRDLQCDYPLYLVTDGHKVVQERKVVALGLRRFFKRMFITHRFGICNAKPSLYCFEIIKRMECCDWDSMVYVGDNPSKDFVNLNRVGSKTIRVRSGAHASMKAHKSFDAQLTIPSLASIKTAILQLAEYECPRSGTVLLKCD